LPLGLGFQQWRGALVVINGLSSLPHLRAYVLWAHSFHPSHLLHLSRERGRELCTGRASGVCWERRSLLSLAAHAMQASLCLSFCLVLYVHRPPAVVHTLMLRSALACCGWSADRFQTRSAPWTPGASVFGVFAVVSPRSYINLRPGGRRSVCLTV
jgi:hypothetical protein